MRRFILVTLVVGLFGFAPNGPSQSGMLTAHAAGTSTIVLDVAVDGRTMAFAGTPGPPVRGAAFIVTGKIYPGGTIPAGGTPDDPSAFGPDEPGSIGTFVCRATFNYSLAEIESGAAPHLTSSQIFYLDDGSALTSDGMEGGTTTIRAVTGGIGAYRTARGEVTQEILGVNETGLPNSHFTFTLAKK
jgi:hypothetical protein